jgi:hypothetical protein
LEPGRGVRSAGVVVIERLRSDRCVPHSTGEAEKGVGSLSSVAAGITSIRRRDYRARSWQKQKASQQERNDKKNGAQEGAVRRISYCYTSGFHILSLRKVPRSCRERILLSLQSTLFAAF